MSAFIIVQAQITDAEKFAAYTAVVPALVEQYGGVYRVLGGQASCLEGEWQPAAMVVSEWPSRAAAETFWHSSDYQQAKKLRAGTGRFQVLLVDGVDEQSLEGDSLQGE